jgi:hypothetical protein
MKHHVVFCYNDHGAHVASCTIDTGAEDFAPGTERWLTAIKGKVQAEVNCVVCIMSWQELVEDLPATEEDFPGNYGPEVVQREKTFEEKRGEGVARGLAEYARKKAAIEAAKHNCRDCDHMPKWAAVEAPEFCKAMGILVTDTTRTTCRKFVTKGTLAPEQRCGDCLYLHPGGCNLLDRHVNANTIGRCGRFAAKEVTP